MKYFLFVLLLAAGLSVSAQDRGELVNIEYLINNGRGEAVYQDLCEIIKKYPREDKAYFLRAKYYFLTSNHKAALQDIDFALKCRYNNAAYHDLKGGILCLAKKYFQAGMSFETAFKTDTAFASCRYKAAKAYFDAQKFDKAENVLKNFADNDSSKLLLAEIFFENGDVISALKTVNTAEKKSAEFYRIRGIIYCKAEMYEESITDLNAALDLKPSLTDIYLWRGLSYYFSMQKQNAKQDWNTALKFRHFKANDYLEKYR
jgi:tetratricopeptide (TPR) repeat protein